MWQCGNADCLVQYKKRLLCLGETLNSVANCREVTPKFSQSSQNDWLVSKFYLFRTTTLITYVCVCFCDLLIYF